MKTGAPKKISVPVTNFRFRDADHHDLVSRAAKARGQSINEWMIRVTLAHAKHQLTKAARQ